MQSFRGVWLASGLELEDAVQHVAIVFSSRLQGAHPFDPARMSLKNYLFMLTRSVLSNQAEKRANRTAVLDVLAARDLNSCELLDEEGLVKGRTPAERERGDWERTKLDSGEDAARLLVGRR